MKSQGWWKPIEVGVCIETPGGAIDQGKWRYHTVTIPANTPLEKLLDVATGRVLDALDEVHIHHTWIQTVGKCVKLEDSPTSESEE
jgi:hypothetical protein